MWYICAQYDEAVSSIRSHRIVSSMRKCRKIYDGKFAGYAFYDITRGRRAVICSVLGGSDAYSVALHQSILWKAEIMFPREKEN